MFDWIVTFTLLGVALFVVWPRRGLWARWQEARGLRARVRREDALKHILKSEVGGRPASFESLAGILQIPRGAVARLLEDLEQRNLVTHAEGRLRLSSDGRELALHVIRAHRLWESYLAEETGVAESEWHRRAERQEHLLTPEEIDALSARLGHPVRDPHGDSIPALVEDLKPDGGLTLGAVAESTPVVISHIEDEPESVYAQISAQGLRVGMKACVIEKALHRIRFWADGHEHVLAPMLANNISVAPLPEFEPSNLFEEEYLAGLEVGAHAQVLGLSPACRGPERRRLLDLGFVPGTAVEVEMVSPAGDPTAYRVRGTVVALRREQAGLIRIATGKAVRA